MMAVSYWRVTTDYTIQINRMEGGRTSLNYLIIKSSGRCFNVFVVRIVLTIIEQRNKEK